MMSRDVEAKPLAHGRLEDAHALCVGVVLVSVGVIMLQKSGLVTGGVAGLALVLTYSTGLPLGLSFTLINVPFLFFAMRVLGREFAIKTAAVTLGLFASTAIFPRLLVIDAVDRSFAAVVGGTIIGVGALSLARHKAGAGGMGAVILWLYRVRGWNAGRTQIFVDSSVLLLALLFISFERVAWSLLSIAATCLVMAAGHRPGRYTGY